MRMRLTVEGASGGEAATHKRAGPWTEECWSPAVLTGSSVFVYVCWRPFSMNYGSRCRDLSCGYWLPLYGIAAGIRMMVKGTEGRQ